MRGRQGPSPKCNSQQIAKSLWGLANNAPCGLYNLLHATCKAEGTAPKFQLIWKLLQSALVGSQATHVIPSGMDDGKGGKAGWRASWPSCRHYGLRQNSSDYRACLVRTICHPEMVTLFMHQFFFPQRNRWRSVTFLEPVFAQQLKD